MKRSITLRCLFLLVILSLAACQGARGRVSAPDATEIPVAAAATSTPEPAKTPVPTATASPTPTAMPLAVAAPEWAGMAIRSLCVELQGVYTTHPEALGVSQHAPLWQRMLQEMGFETVAGQEGCDATVHTFIELTFREAQYDSGASCPANMLIHGYMVVSAPGKPALFQPISTSVGEADLIIIGGCPDKEYAFTRDWAKTMLESLSQLLGPSVITALYQSEDMDARQAAFAATGSLGPEDIAVLPDVLAAMRQNDDLQARSQLASGIEAMGPEAQQAAAEIVPLLIAQIDSAGLDSLFLVETFGKLGPAAKDAVPHLMQWFQEADPESDFYRKTVAIALGKIGPAAAPAVPLLLEWLQNMDSTLFLLEGIDALVQIGSGTEEAAALLIDEARKGDPGAVDALDKLGPVIPEVIPVLMENARNPQQYKWSWRQALRALAHMHAHDPEILPMILAKARSSDPNMAEAGIDALAETGATSPEVVDLLKASLAHANPQIRAAATEAIRKRAAVLEDDLRDTVPTLMAMAKTTPEPAMFDLMQHYAALETLTIWDSGSPEILALYAQLLPAEGLPDVVLAQLGPEARALVPAMIDRLAFLQEGEYLMGDRSACVGALVAITGAYPGPSAADWQRWQAEQGE